VPRAARRTSSDEAVWLRSEEVLAAVNLVPLRAELLREAAQLTLPELRSLDAIHLASALSLAPDLAGLVAYDSRLASAARSAGLPVLAPGA
jgi:predicted nucleic acid-binding protein